MQASEHTHTHYYHVQVGVRFPDVFLTCADYSPAQKAPGTKLLKTTALTAESLDRVDTTSLICLHTHTHTHKHIQGDSRAQSVCACCV